mmetsp:Transcript_62280/g.167116  ORF Transcript_62280/g.167116 Transcript_62280/m.167116 type:complete len:251 (-) Transcript_62280:527-1279(-)
MPDIRAHAGRSDGRGAAGPRRCARADGAEACSDLPVDGRLAGLGQVLVDEAEVLAAEEALGRGQRRRVGCLEHLVPLGVHGLALVLRRAAPQQEHQPLPLARHRRDDGVGESFPPPLLVAVGLRAAHREHGVEHEDALLGPARQAAVRGPLEPGHPGVRLQLLVHVDQAGRCGDARLDAEGQPVGLAGAVVGVLPHHHHRHLVQRAEVEGGEDLVERGEHLLARRDLAGDEFVQFLEVLLRKFSRKCFFP